LLLPHYLVHGGQKIIRLKPWLYIPPDDICPEAENCCALLPANLLPYRSTGFFLINMMNYLIKSIFKDKPSTVLKWAFSLCSAVSTCLHCDLWQKVNYISKFYQPSLNETCTISKSAQSLSTFSNNKSNGIF
jgi:hypothetical protein